MRLAARAPWALALFAVVAGGSIPAVYGERSDERVSTTDRATRVVRKVTRSERRQGKLPYLLYLPAGYDDASRLWPLLVALHGSRGGGVDPEKLARYPIGRLVEAGEHAVPFVVLLPQAPPGRLWTEVDGLMGLIDEIASDHRIDRRRLYLTGQSMGAQGVWQVASDNPGTFAAIAPMFGEGDPAWAERLAGTPVWVFHGARDTVVPVEASDRMVVELRKHGAEVRYSRYDDRHHEPPSPGELAELIEWFLTHRLP